MESFPRATDSFNYGHASKSERGESACRCAPYNTLRRDEFIKDPGLIGVSFSASTSRMENRTATNGVDNL